MRFCGGLGRKFQPLPRLLRHLLLDVSVVNDDAKGFSHLGFAGVAPVSPETYGIARP